MKKDHEDEINIPTQLVINLKMRLNICFLEAYVHIASHPCYFSSMFITALVQAVEHQHVCRDVSL